MIPLSSVGLETVVLYDLSPLVVFLGDEVSFLNWTPAWFFA